MRKTYKCSNIKFCMEDENQRRTWEYLQGITRKDGSYGKILSDAFVAVLNGQMQAGADRAVNDSIIPAEKEVGIFEEMLDRALEQKLHEMLQKLQKVLGEQISSGFREYASGFHSSTENSADVDGIVQMQEAELSEDMMAFAFAMGE